MKVTRPPYCLTRSMLRAFRIQKLPPTRAPARPTTTAPFASLLRPGVIRPAAAQAPPASSTTPAVPQSSRLAMPAIAIIRPAAESPRPARPRLDAPSAPQTADTPANLSAAASANQAQALARAARSDAPELRRLLADVAIQAGTGKFFADKFRSAVLWSLYERTGDRTALMEALKAYRAARQAWATMADSARKVYVADVTYGPNANLRGHWADRTAGINRAGRLVRVERAQVGKDGPIPRQAFVDDASG